MESAFPGKLTIHGYTVEIDPSFPDMDFSLGDSPWWHLMVAYIQRQILLNMTDNGRPN